MLSALIYFSALTLLVLGSPTTKPVAEAARKELKADELYDLIDKPVQDLFAELRVDPKTRVEYQKVMSVLADLKLSTEERKRLLIDMYPDDTYEIAEAIPLYETIGTELIKNYFHAKPDKGAEFYKRCMLLLGEESYIAADKTVRMEKLKDVIDEYEQFL